MAIQPIRLFGDPILRTPAAPVETFDKELRRLVKDLTDTMMEAPGAGLAAPQIGVSLRVFTYWVDDEHFDLSFHVRHTALPQPGGDVPRVHDQPAVVGKGLLARVRGDCPRLGPRLPRGRESTHGVEGDPLALGTELEAEAQWLAVARCSRLELGIGFGATVKSKSERKVSELFREVEPEDLIKFGLIPELVGRMPVVATLAELSEDALVEILTTPKNALVKQYTKLFAMEGAALEIRPSALKAIARKALARKTGARGLRSILEHALIDTMFDLPHTANVERVVVDEATVEEGKPPLVVFREAAKQA